MLTVCFVLSVCRDTPRRQAVGAAAQVGARLARAVCEAANGHGRRSSLLPNVAAVQRLRESCPEVSQLLLLNLTCATQHLHVCMGGMQTLHGSCSSSSSKKTSAQAQGTQQQQELRPVVPYHDCLLAAQSLMGFRPEQHADTLYYCSQIRQVIDQGLDAFFIWHFPAELASSQPLFSSSNSSSDNEGMRPWKRQQQLASSCAPETESSKEIAVRLPGLVCAPLLLVLTELQLLQPTLENMHKVLLVMQQVHEQFVESFDSMTTLSQKLEAKKESAMLLKSTLLYLGPAVLQVRGYQVYRGMRLIVCNCLEPHHQLQVRCMHDLRGSACVIIVRNLGDRTYNSCLGWLSLCRLLQQLRSSSSSWQAWCWSS